jgi:hypothetical protein
MRMKYILSAAITCALVAPISVNAGERPRLLGIPENIPPYEGPSRSGAPHDSPIDLSAPPLTSVVVTQCGILIAAYITLDDGTLLRFDRSERVEVSCEGPRADLRERHHPV